MSMYGELIRRDGKYEKLRHGTAVRRGCGHHEADQCAESALVVGFAVGTGSTRRAVLIWYIYALEQLSWIRVWIYDLSRGYELKSKPCSHSANVHTKYDGSLTICDADQHAEKRWSHFHREGRLQ